MYMDIYSYHDTIIVSVPVSAQGFVYEGGFRNED